MEERFLTGKLLETMESSTFVNETRISKERFKTDKIKICQLLAKLSF